MSEFGLQSFPGLKTIETFTLPEDRNIFSYVMESHQKNGTSNEKILYYISENFKYPKNFDSLTFVSQLIQAEGMRYGVEHWRRNRGRCMGAIYWQLNDCWPVASWSSIDYYGRWKAMHYAAKRFFEPILASACEEGTTVSLHVTNDKLEKFSGILKWSLVKCSGEVIKTNEIDIMLEGLSTKEIVSLDFKELLNTKKKQREIYLEYSLIEHDYILSDGTVLFVKSKHFDFMNPEMALDINEEADRFTIDIFSKSYAKFVELNLKDADATFSDNIFDLTSNRVKRIEVIKDNISQRLTLDSFKDQLIVRSLYDTYEEVNLRNWSSFSLIFYKARNNSRLI